MSRYASQTEGADVTRYPLVWPAGWKRTPAHQRRRAALHQTRVVSTRLGDQEHRYRQKEALSVGTGLDRLRRELGRLGATRIIISSNLRVRGDGLRTPSRRSS